jgi:AcrR family transcriptional regulator
VTRESILRAAAIVFAADGYSAARLTDVAALIGMKAGSLYYHFDSRESLVEALLERGMQHTHGTLLETLAALPKDASPLIRLKAAIECHFMAVVEQEEFARASVKLFNQIPEPIRQRHLRNLKAYAKVWRQLLKDAQAANVIRPDISRSLARMTIVGALNSASEWFQAGKLPAKEVGKQMSTILLQGLSAREEEDASAEPPRRKLAYAGRFSTN